MDGLTSILTGTTSIALLIMMFCIFVLLCRFVGWQIGLTAIRKEAEHTNELLEDIIGLLRDDNQSQDNSE